MSRALHLLAGLWLLIALPAHAQTVEYIHTDALGSPVAVTDANRNVIERSEYEPYGQVINRPLRDGPGYTGHVEDAATGLVNMQQRMFDPVLGRFLSVDPVTAYGGDMRFFNRYAYAFNSPYTFKDPDGRIAVNIGGGIIGGIVGGIGGAVVTAIRGGSSKEIVASAIGGAVGGAFTGATLGTGAGQGAIIAAGVTGGLLGEATAQTVGNAADHGTKLSNYEYSAGKLAVSGVMGAADSMTGGLVSDVAGSALKEGTKAVVTEAGLMPVKTVTEVAIAKHEKQMQSSSAPRDIPKPRIDDERPLKK
jgi:RHS repeat-associated protein